MSAAACGIAEAGRRLPDISAQADVEFYESGLEPQNASPAFS
jgi:hypothetical protein